MRSAIWLLLAFAFAQLSPSASALAEKRVALVIGNGAYTAATPLPNPRNDAEDVAAALKRIGFETIVGLDLDQAQMQERTIDFARVARDADVALFYYSGHAIQFAGVNYLMPVDAKLSDEADLRRMARVDDIVADLQQAKNLRILVLDACRDNPLADELKRSIGLTRAASLGRGLARVDAPQGMIVAFSTQEDRTADDGKERNSPYTTAFLKHIESQGEIGTLFRRISADVYQATDRKQLPELKLSMIGEYYLRGEPADTPAMPQTGVVDEQEAGYRYLARRLGDAKLSKPALAAFLQLCGPDCPKDLRQNAEKKLARISTEDAEYRAASGDPTKLRAYIDNCELCSLQSEATARLENIKAEHARLSERLRKAGDDKPKLTAFLRDCTGICPDELRAQARDRLAAIDQRLEEQQRPKAEADPRKEAGPQVRWVYEYRINEKKPILGRFEQVDAINWVDTKSRAKLHKVASPGATDQFVDQAGTTKFRIDILERRIFKSVGETGWAYFADLTAMRAYRKPAKQSTRTGSGAR